MKKVVMLTTDRKLDRRIVLEARSLCKFGYDVTIIGLAWDGEKEKYPYEPFRLIRVGKQLKNSSNDPEKGIYFLLYKIYTILNRLNPYSGRLTNMLKSILRSYGVNIEKFYNNLFIDEAYAANGNIYHVHDLHPLPAGVNVANRLNAKLIYDSHELFVEQEFSERERNKWIQIEKKYIHSADNVITINESIADELSKRYSIPHPTVIHNCESAIHNRPLSYDRSLLLEKYGFKSNRRILLYQGGVIRHKNLEGIVRAMKHVQYSDVLLICLGSGDLKPELEKIVTSDYSLHSRVLLLDEVPQNELLGITRLADIGIIPYQANCMNALYCTPNKLYEFIAAGIPILASDLPELRKIITGYHIGWIADLSTPQRIASIIDHVFSDPDALESRKRNASKAFQELNWEKEERKLIDMYEKQYF